MSPHMNGDVAHHRSAELDALRNACLRVRSGDLADPLEIERVLEAGFAAMIGLEAELSRLRRRAPPSPEPGTERVASLKTRIAELSDALNELRTLAAPAGEPRIGFGFVLPTTRRQKRI